MSVRTRRGADPLGLRHGLGDRLLPVLVAAMAFLAVFALAVALGAEGFARHWRGAGSSLTALVPQPASGDRLPRALALLRESPAVAEALPLDEPARREMLKPWLGEADALPEGLLPSIVAVRRTPDAAEAELDRLADALATAVPGATLERHAGWVARLATLLGAVQAAGWGALGLVAGVSALVVVAGTRAGLVARRAAVDILHGLGATDGYVAGGFARRAALLAGLGGVCGTLLAVPALVALARVAAPFGAPASLTEVPGALWAGLGVIPAGAAALGWLTAQTTVRAWLARLP